MGKKKTENLIPEGHPSFPKRAVITGGMPYGNKGLHFGHVGGVFVQADTFARFLKDRIGPENVLFVSGTDCFGSPIVEDHRKQVESKQFEGDLQAFVRSNHERQKASLAAYHIEPSLFAASSLEPYRSLHEALGEELMVALHQHGHLAKRTTAQFYDAERETFLNGRQVIGKCPISGCRSDKAYADECALGHQYEPRELINPRSVLTGQRPEMRDVTNWYLKLPAMRGLLARLMDDIVQSGAWRRTVTSSMREFFEPPMIHITRDQIEPLDEISERLPAHKREPGRGKSLQLIFETLEAMDDACTVLAAADIRYRTGKTLVPFRMTGNLDWGLKAPVLDGLEGVTFWVWPESLWAPISFTAAYLQAQGKDPDGWREWWCSRDAEIYQFIGEDNVFFYGLPEMGMFLGIQGASPAARPDEGELQVPLLVANRHVLFLDKKASSSGKVKPPMADALLAYYTADQLRAHFLSMALGQRSVSFRPKPFSPEADTKGGDAVLKEGNMLCNSLNRAVRSCFYTAQKFFENRLPACAVSEDVAAEAMEFARRYEWAMARHEFQQVIVVVAEMIKAINKRWSARNPFYDDCEPEARPQLLVDAFHLVRVVLALVHPIAPDGAERTRECLNLGPELWSWDHLDKSINELSSTPETHKLKDLPKHFDFFPKHPSQVSDKEIQC